MGWAISQEDDVKNKLMAKVTLDLLNGGKVIDYMPVKTKNQFGKRMEKMLKGGVFHFASVSVDVGMVAEAFVSFEGVH